MATGQASAASAVHAPSWFDALADWIDRGSRRRFWVYGAVFFACLCLVFGPGWIAREGADLHLVPFHLVLAGTAAYMLFFMHATRRWLARGHDLLADLVDMSPEEFHAWRLKITTTPAAPTLAFGIAAGAGATLLLLPLARRPELGLFQSPGATVAHLALLAFTSFVIATYVCRAGYRTVWSRRLHEAHLKVDLLRPEPLFAQTGVLARGGSTLIAYTVLWIVTAPGAFEHLGFVVTAGIVNAIAVLLYLVPLLRFHRMLVAEKRKLLLAAYDRARHTSAEVHDALRSGRLDVLDPLSKGLAGLQVEISLLERLSTWPWHPELSRVTLTALFVPVALYVIQRVLQGWL